MQTRAAVARVTYCVFILTDRVPGVCVQNYTAARMQTRDYDEIRYTCILVLRALWDVCIRTTSVECEESPSERNGRFRPGRGGGSDLLGGGGFRYCADPSPGEGTTEGKRQKQHCCVMRVHIRICIYTRVYSERVRAGRTINQSWCARTRSFNCRYTREIVVYIYIYLYGTRNGLYTTRVRALTFTAHRIPSRKS